MFPRIDVGVVWMSSVNERERDKIISVWVVDRKAYCNFGEKNQLKLVKSIR